jgi:threonine dehydrogenase-like Zn-dependent dehydrogenase
MALCARLCGARPVAVFGRHERWRTRFEALGVGYLTPGSQPDWVRDRVRGDGFERVVEAVGSRAALEQCIHLAGTGGRVGVYGIPPESEPYDPADAANPRVSWPKVAEAEVHEQMLELIARGQVNLADWVSHQLPWQEFQAGFALVWNKEANGPYGPLRKVVLTFDGSGRI